jgi:deazaflavin-dependent oxidoreductase (nitroreductase family)
LSAEVGGVSFKHRLMHHGNAIGVWIHHAFKGRLDAFGDQTVLMVMSPGRRTGRPRSTMVRYLDHDGGYLVWGTGSGSPTDPDWFCNLRHAGEATVEIGTRAETVTATELRGEERDRVWRDVVLAKVPGVAKYEAKAGRIIPVALLRPVTIAGPG